MFDRLRRWCAAPAALALSVNAAAQDAPALEQRLRQLDALRRDARVAVTEDLRSRREPLDTVTVGSLVVVVRPVDAALVQRAAVAAWGKLDSLYGDGAQRLAATHMLFFLQGRPIYVATPALEHLQGVTAQADATPDDVAFRLLSAGSLAIRESMDTALANWLGPMLLPDVAPSVERSRVYIELVTAPSIAVRRCYAGALDACGAALGVLQGDRVVLWYDAAERRTVVRRAQQDVHSMGLRPAIDACLQAESDDACLDVLHALSRFWIEPPLSNEARQSLARLVLASGGRSAFTRLAHSAGRPMPQRMAIAAGLPLDSVLHRWRDQIIAARPHPVTLAASIGWTAFGWSIVFGLLALRSTRWR